MIKNIVFDFGNVIIKWNVDDILRNYATNNEELEKLKKEIFQSEEWDKLDRGSLSAEQAEKIFENRLPSELKCKAKEIMNSWFEKVEFHKEVCEFIKSLKDRGYKVYGLSNTTVQFYEYIRDLEIGKYFDGFLISAVEKMMKPDEEIYYRLFEKFELKPDECFFLDDTEKNIVASKKCGMQGMVFDISKFEEIKKEFENII